MKWLCNCFCNIFRFSSVYKKNSGWHHKHLAFDSFLKKTSDVGQCDDIYYSIVSFKTMFFVLIQVRSDKKCFKKFHFSKKKIKLYKIAIKNTLCFTLLSVKFVGQNYFNRFICCCDFKGLKEK